MHLNSIHNKEKVDKRNKIALIIWALIHNNIASASIYIIAMIIDFVIQLMLLLGIYKSANVLPFEVSFTDSMALLNLDEQLALFIGLSTFGVLLVLLIVLIVLFLK